MGLLGQPGHVTGDPGAGHQPDVDAPDAGAAGGGLQEVEEDVERARLTGPAAADQRDAVSRRHGERDVVKDGGCWEGGGRDSARRARGGPPGSRSQHLDVVEHGTGPSGWGAGVDERLMDRRFESSELEQAARGRIPDDPSGEGCREQGSLVEGCERDENQDREQDP